MSQNPLLQKIALRSLNLNCSSLSPAASWLAEASSFLSITQYTMYEIIPMQSANAPKSTGDETRPNDCATGRAKNSAHAVPTRASATCKPIARAIS